MYYVSFDGDVIELEKDFPEIQKYNHCAIIASSVFIFCYTIYGFYLLNT